jgi:hypothetical protein
VNIDKFAASVRRLSGCFLNTARYAAATEDLGYIEIVWGLGVGFKIEVKALLAAIKSGGAHSCLEKAMDRVNEALMILRSARNRIEQKQHKGEE